MFIELLTATSCLILASEPQVITHSQKAQNAYQVLLLEDFEDIISIEAAPSVMSQSWITKTLPGDTVTTSTWTQAFGNAFQGQGYLTCSPLDMSLVCVDKAKGICSPVLRWETSDQVSVSYRVRHGGNYLRTLPEVILVPVDAEGNFTDGMASQPSHTAAGLQKNAGAWVRVEKTFPAPAGFFRIQINFQSSPSQNLCLTTSIDDFQVSGRCSDEPDTYISAPGSGNQPIIIGRDRPTTLTGMAVGPNATGATLTWRVETNGAILTQSTGSTFTYAFQETGHHTITCTATSDCGATDLTPDTRTYLVEDCRQDLPITVITDPPDPGGVSYFAVDQPLIFAAGLAEPGPENITFYWQLLAADDSVVQADSGEHFSLRIEDVGSYTVTCRAQNSCGDTSTNPARRALLIVADPKLNTIITQPSEAQITLLVGSSQEFKATALSSADEVSTFTWRRKLERAARDEIILEGAAQTIEFPEAGYYTVTCAAGQRGYQDPTPAGIRVRVVEAKVRILSPQAIGSRLNINSGTTLDFKGLVADPSGLVTNKDWVLQPGGQIICSDTVTCAIDFNEQGSYGVVFGDNNYRDIFHVEVDAALTVSAWFEDENGDQTNEAAILKRFTLKGAVSGSLAKDPELVSVWLLNGIELSPDDDHTPDFSASGLSKPGYYQARLLVVHPDADTVEASVDFQIYDPAQPPDATIISPATDLHIAPGNTLFFESSFRNTRMSRRNASWQITGPGSQPFRTGSGATLGQVTFAEPGTYQVDLLLFDERGSFLTDTRLIEVGDTVLEQGAVIAFGEYRNQSLGSQNHFLVDMPRDGLTFRLEAELDADTQFEMHTIDGALVHGPVMLKTGRSRVDVRDLTSGLYRIGLQPQGSAKVFEAGRVSLLTVPPNLYFSGIVQDGKYGSEIGIVNPNNQAAEITIFGYDLAGNQLPPNIEYEIPAKGSYKRKVALFPDPLKANNIAWIRVNATRELVGYSQALSAKDAYAVSGTPYLERLLYVPHIAQDISKWFTRGNIVNGMESTIDPRFEATNSSTQLNNEHPRSKDDFDFQAMFMTSMGASADHGAFVEFNEVNALTGIEIFGTHATDQVAGLGLVGPLANNTNLLTTGKTFYFAHIADPAQFWTSLALVNLESSPTDVEVIAYGPEGMELCRGMLRLSGNMKIAKTFSDFFAMVNWTSPCPVEMIAKAEWAEIRTNNANITAYELFGDRLDKKMAGLEAITRVKNQICMPFVDDTGNFTHGISVANIGEKKTTVTFTLYNNMGQAVGSVMRVLEAHQRQIYLLKQDLFDPLPLAASWLEVTANQQLVGFELFSGGLDKDEHMSGLIAQ